MCKVACSFENLVHTAYVVTAMAMAIHKKKKKNAIAMPRSFMKPSKKSDPMQARQD
jgi:hypothetical protein